jgi:hypothetical protein
MLDEKFEPFTFSAVGVSIYHIGSFATSSREPQEWEFEP